MIETLAVHGFRSLREVVLNLGRVSVITGANGTGKSNLYRAFHLLADTASGRLIRGLAAAGGLSSVLWAGPEQITGAMRRGEQPIQGSGRRLAPVSLQLGFTTDAFGYLIDLGLPVPSASMFARDPMIKREVIWAGPVLRPAATLVERTARGVRVAGADGRTDLSLDLAPWSSLLDELVDPITHPDIAAVREVVRGWRFYDSFRVDPDAPARQPQVGTRTDVLAGDGHDLAPAIATILESAWAEPLQQAVGDAFSGSALTVTDSAGRFEVGLRQPGLLRALSAHELSDGTLRYLLLAAALLSPRPPGLMVLNEPETSLHPDVLPALARLVRRAADRTQLVVVTHSAALVTALAAAGATHHELIKPHGETEIENLGLLTRPTWHWGRR
ncbi:MAG TPA: AAA family ATPase [Micropruina sp.]|nr:AAA family ATPase [Micropruina sp.]